MVVLRDNSEDVHAFQSASECVCHFEGGFEAHIQATSQPPFKTDTHTQTPSQVNGETISGMNETPSSERTQIAFFGVRNAGKSSLVNAITGQDLSVVSNVAGTTTDAVRKAMELTDAGPVVIIDTPGIDDAGDLGAKRAARARKILHTCDVAVLVISAAAGLCQADKDLLKIFREQRVSFIVALNKSDLLEGENGVELELELDAELAAPIISCSAKTGEGIDALKHEMARVCVRVQKGLEEARPLVRDLIGAGDVLVLVIPIDSSAPRGRIILPQQMVMRDVLDAHATCVSCQVEELDSVLNMLGADRDSTARVKDQTAERTGEQAAANSKKPPVRMVITDSQAFKQVAQIVPESVPLTSFSILMARYKGNINQLLEGARALDALTNKSRVLVSEACTHHRRCEDIGTVKIPALIYKRTGAKPQFTFTSGRAFPDNLSEFDLVIHCGACMLSAREMNHRLRLAAAQGVPTVNYGLAISNMHNILPRAIAPLNL